MCLPPFTPQTLLKVKMPTVTRTLRWQGCKSVALENCHWIQNRSVSTAFHQHLHAWLHTRAPTTRMTYSRQHCHPSLELEATVMPLGVDRINTLWCFLPTGVLCNTVKECSVATRASMGESPCHFEFLRKRFQNVCVDLGDRVCSTVVILQMLVCHSPWTLKDRRTMPLTLSEEMKWVSLVLSAQRASHPKPERADKRDSCAVSTWQRTSLAFVCSRMLRKFTPIRLETKIRALRV